MPKKIIYQHAFLTADIMCFDGCGLTVDAALNDLSEFKKSNLLPQDAEIMIDAEPQSFGLNKLLIMVESETFWPSVNEEAITQAFKQAVVNSGYELIEEDGETRNGDTRNGEIKQNRRNLFINLVVLAILISLSIALPPSLPLTVSLIVLSFLTTAYTSRHYFLHFWRGIRTHQWLNMSAGVSLGWLLSLGHALYHTISMPGMVGFSITFMNASMPVMLITIVNILDEIQHRVKASTRKMQLQGMKSLFHFSATYQSYEPLVHAEVPFLSEDNCWVPRPKAHLKPGMLIQIQRGECIPVDGKIVQGMSLIDTSILNGETKKLLGENDDVPAGSINLGQQIIIQAQENAYKSTVNRVLFRANRAQISSQSRHSKPQTFSYFYGSLLVVSIFISIFIPAFLGTLTLPLALQSITGIVFAICPCTIVIAHRLPRLLMRHRLYEKGIVLRDENFLDRRDKMHTMIFDKTGTLTSGNSEVVFSNAFPAGLWQRIYLLEQRHGAGHPLAQAICHYYEKRFQSSISIHDTSSVVLDEKHRGLAGKVQGRRVQIGSYDYLKEAHVCQLPVIALFSELKEHVDKGYTPIYVAEDGVYQGAIFVKHTIAPSILSALKRLKKDGPDRVKLIMLTGDTEAAAKSFHRQCDEVFDVIHAGKMPHEKETIVKELMESGDSPPEGYGFVCDGVNDIILARFVNEKRGVSYAMHDDDKAAFFTDMSLNGSLEYLLQSRDLNRRLKRNILQNQGLLMYGSLIFLIFLICLPLAGVGVLPVIPLLIMVSTTCMTLFNASRVRVIVDVGLDGAASWIKRCFASDISLVLLVSGSALLVLSLLMITFASGHLVLPAFVFSAGVSTAVSSGFLLASVVLLGGFTGLTLAYFMTNRRSFTSNQVVTQEQKQTISPKKQPEVLPPSAEFRTLPFGYGSSTRPKTNMPNVLRQTLGDMHGITPATDALHESPRHQAF